VKRYDCLVSRQKIITHVRAPVGKDTGGQTERKREMAGGRAETPVADREKERERW